MTNEKNIRRINFKGYIEQKHRFDEERSELHRMCHQEDLDGLCDLFRGMNFTSPEYLIDVLIPALHTFAVCYAMEHDLRSSTEFTIDFFNNINIELFKYGSYLVEEASK